MRIYVIASEKKPPSAGIEPRSPRENVLRSERSSTVLAGPGGGHIYSSHIPGGQLRTCLISNKLNYGISFYYKNAQMLN